VASTAVRDVKVWTFDAALGGPGSEAAPRAPGSSTSYTYVVKIAVSVPDPLHQRADQLASRLGLKRSQLYARAVEEFLLAHEGDPVTAALDALAEPEDGEASRSAGRALIASGQWEW
jgi:predicted DNA-binding protein